MRTYVVFHTGTGEVVHTHVEDDGASTSPDGVLALVHPAHDRKLLRVIEVAGAPPGACCRVNVGTGALEPAQPGQVTGFGSGGVRVVRAEGAPRVVKTLHEKDVP